MDNERTEGVSKGSFLREEEVSQAELLYEAKLILEELAKNSIYAKKILKSFSDCFTDMESSNGKVSDVVMGSSVFEELRKYGGVAFERTTSGKMISLGLMGTLWGVRAWVAFNSPEIFCFEENSIHLKDMFPVIFENMKTLGLRY
jgi:hypothetical protein